MEGVSRVFPNPLTKFHLCPIRAKCWIFKAVNTTLKHKTAGIGGIALVAGLYFASRTKRGKAIIDFCCKKTNLLSKGNVEKTDDTYHPVSFTSTHILKTYSSDGQWYYLTTLPDNEHLYVNFNDSTNTYSFVYIGKERVYTPDYEFCIKSSSYLKAIVKDMRTEFDSFINVFKQDCASSPLLSDVLIDWVIQNFIERGKKGVPKFKLPKRLDTLL